MRIGPLLLAAGLAMALFAAPCLAADTKSLNVDGLARSYVIAGPTGSGPRPTVVMLHGTGTDAPAFAKEVKLTAIAQREGFVVVYPDTLPGKWWNAFPVGYVPEAKTEGERRQFGTTDDVAFVKALVADLVRQGVADPKRVYLGGISFGGLMAMRIVCSAPEMFAAVGIIYSSMPDATGRDCRSPKPLPLVVMNGTADPVLPYAGGPTIVGFSVWSTDQTLSYFRKLDGCTDAAEQSQLPRSGGGQTYVVLQRWTHCTRGPVVLYQIVGGGHRVRGSLNNGFVAFEAMWNFFRNQTLDGR